MDPTELNKITDNRIRQRVKSRLLMALGAAAVFKVFDVWNDDDVFLASSEEIKEVSENDPDAWRISNEDYIHDKAGMFFFNPRESKGAF